MDSTQNLQSAHLKRTVLISEKMLLFLYFAHVSIWLLTWTVLNGASKQGIEIVYLLKYMVPKETYSTPHNCAVPIVFFFVRQ